MSSDGVCKYCGMDKKLIDAHIIPKGFLGNLNEQKFLEVSTEYSYTKKRPKGPYDQKILCSECDASIGIYDGYAKKLLIDDIDLYRDAKHPFYCIPKHSYDYQTLKRFFISLVWRADISDAAMFNPVSLGSYSDVALSQLKGGKLQDDIFAVILFKDSASLKYQNVISFAASKLAGKKACKIHFAGYQVTIIPNAADMVWKASNNTTLPSEMFLKKGSDFYILEVDEDLSGKDKMLQKIYQRYW